MRPEWVCPNCGEGYDEPQPWDECLGCRTKLTTPLRRLLRILARGLS